jgi:hypothetical protein
MLLQAQLPDLLTLIQLPTNFPLRLLLLCCCCTAATAAAGPITPCLPFPFFNACSQNMLFVEASAKTAACVSDIFESVAAKLAGGLPVSVGARAAA